MAKAIIQLESLTCPSCKLKIEKAAKSLPGVDPASVEVLFNASKLKLDFNAEQIVVADIEKAVTALGYEVKKSQVKDN